MTDRVLIQQGNHWLALNLEDYQKAVDLGATLRPSTMPVERSNDDEPVWWRICDVATVCSISETFLRDEISLKRIRTRRFGRSVRIHRDYIEHQTGDLMSNDDNDE